MQTLEIAVRAIEAEMLRIIERQQIGLATVEELYNLAVFTKCIEHLSLPADLFAD